LNDHIFILALVVSTAESVGATLAATEENMTQFSPTEQIIRQFEALDMYYTGGRYEQEKFSYRLYAPPHVDANNKYPLLLWLHGSGESGNDNRKHLVHIDKALALFAKRRRPFPGFVLAPQVPKGASWFTGNTSRDDDMLMVAWTMLQRIMQRYPIDEDRIFLAGVSSGGAACWEMGMRYPGRFAAIAPIASGGGDEVRAAQLVGTPIWALHNLHDKRPPIESVRRMVAAVRDAGGHAELTEIPNLGHAAWNQALGDHKLLDWLLARRRGESSWKPYVQFVNWRQVSVQFGLPALIAVACWMEFRRRNHMAVRLSINAAAPTNDDGELLDFSLFLRDE